MASCSDSKLMVRQSWAYLSPSPHRSGGFFFIYVCCADAIPRSSVGSRVSPRIGGVLCARLPIARPLCSLMWYAMPLALSIVSK